jgi:flagellar biosynthesis protein FlhF
MLLETFRGPELHDVVNLIRSRLGDDAMLLRTVVTNGPGGREVEVVAALASEVEELRTRLDGGPSAAATARGRGRIGPQVVAVVGPSGAGKTTACMKMALASAAFGRRRVGVVTMDTYRVGALEEIHTYGEIAGLPVEVAYSVADAPGTLQRLRDRDVVIVDTPGRGWGGGAVEWPQILRALDPDEVHLAMPSGLRLDVIRTLTLGIEGVRPTHVLFTKLDEVSTRLPLAVMADAAKLPARWVSSGPEVPAGFGPAAPRILSSLGIGPGAAARGALAAG